jgi:hypothetical protein
MNGPARNEGVPFILAAGFIAIFILLLWLVRAVSRSQGWHDIGTPARPLHIRSRGASRAIGALFALAGSAFMAWSWQQAHQDRFFITKMAAGGPAFVGMGAWMMIEGPELPANRPSPLGWSLSLAGLALGFLYAEFLRTGRLPFVP